METSDKTKISSDFIFTKLAMLACLAFFVYEFFQERRTRDVYTELYFLMSIAILCLVIFYFTRPRVYSDNSSFYFKKFNKAEIQVSFKDIQTIEKNSIHKGGYKYKIGYINKDNKNDRITFYTDSYEQMEDLSSLIKESNREVMIF